MNTRNLCVCLAGASAAFAVLSIGPSWRTSTEYIPVSVALADGTKSSDSKAPSPEPGSVESFKDYHKWRRVNAEPYYVAPIPAAACAAAVVRSDDDANPHLAKYIVVYVNRKGAHTLYDAERKSFPVGSMIVKEKHPARDSKTPELLTAMVKREAGYNPDNGDWQYVALSGDATKVTASGKLENCQSCHESVKDQDYVFGDYVPKQTRKEQPSNPPPPNSNAPG